MLQSSVFSYFLKTDLRQVKVYSPEESGRIVAHEKIANENAQCRVELKGATIIYGL